jgi:hypothetical protein
MSAIRWCAAGLLLALQVCPARAETSDRCASDVLRAAGLAASDVLRAHMTLPSQPEPDAVDAALAKARKRLAHRLSKATRRGICASPIDVDAIWSLTRQFGTDVSSLVVSPAEPVGLTGTWTLTGAPSAGDCTGDTPFFADVVEITQTDASLDATAFPFSYDGTVDGTHFEMYAVSGAVGCDEGGAYDVNLAIVGEQIAPGTYQVTQRYGHYLIGGTCPPCSVEWEGTMTRAASGK